MDWIIVGMFAIFGVGAFIKFCVDIWRTGDGARRSR